MPISSSKPFKPTQKLFLNEKDVKTLWQILPGNPAISSFVGCFKATLINAGMLEMISVMRNQKPLYFIVLLTTELCVIVYCPADAGPGLGQYDLFCPDVLGQGVRYAPAVIDEGGSEQRFYDLFYSVGLRLWLLHFNLTCSVG